MAIGVENYVNASAPSSAYPKGNITDDPTGIAGTPVDVNTYTDIHQTFMRILQAVNVTANNSPDNNTNGYQYFNALTTLMGRDAWISGGTPTISAVGGGTATIGSVVYNRYKLTGKTLRWQMQLTGVAISGTVSQINIQTPSPIYTSGSGFANALGQYKGGVYLATTFNDLLLILDNPAGNPTIYLQPFTPGGAGAPFTAGTGQKMFIDIEAELT